MRSILGVRQKLLVNLPERINQLVIMKPSLIVKQSSGTLERVNTNDSKLNPFLSLRLLTSHFTSHIHLHQIESKL